MEGRTVTDSDLTPRGTDAIDPGDDRHDADPFDAAMPATPPSELRSFRAKSARSGADWLPFFSKLNLMQHGRQLHNMRFPVSISRLDG